MILVTWLPYRARNGSIYFHHTASGCESAPQISPSSSWTLPEDCIYKANVLDADGEPDLRLDSDRERGIVNLVIGDGTATVNDPQSWRCYQVDDSKCGTKVGTRYYFNVLSGEKSWRCPPGCSGKQPVNLPESWLTFTSEEHGGRNYYFNIMSKETTWTKPHCLSIRAEEDEAADDLGGDSDQDQEFAIPQNFEDLQNFSDLEEDEFENEDTLVAKKSTQESSENELHDDSDIIQFGKANEFPALSKQPERSEISESEVKSEKLIKDQFEKLLDINGVMHYSQWSNWVSKLGNSPQLLDVPVERRSSWFKDYTVKLIGRERETRLRRIKACRDILKECCDHEPLFADEISKFAEGKDLLGFLSAAQTNPDLSFDKGMLFRLRTAFSAVSSSDQSRALRAVRQE